MFELLKNTYNLNENELNDYINFINIYLENNEKFNLSTITNLKEIEIKHIIDSLSSINYFKENLNIIDVGTGSGFPIIPIILKNKNSKYYLIESTGKKCNYLNEIKNKMNLNIEVKNGRAEDFGKDELREKGDIVTARAVARLNSLIEYCLPLVKVGGIFIAYKSDDIEEELKEALGGIKILGGKLKEIVEYSLPENEGNRKLIIIEKIKETPKGYPRGNGKERKHPL